MAPRYEDSLDQIRKSAPRYLRRAHAAGAKSVTIDDLIGEMNLAWTIASQRFNPELGVPFAPYLALGIQRHVNRYIDEQIGHANGVFSLDEPASSHDGQDLAHQWLVADTAPRPDEELEEKDLWARAMSELSPEAAKFVSLLREPPLALYEEMNAIQARAENARGRGISSSSPKAITGNLVLDLMGVDRVGRNRIYGELKALGEFLSQEVNH